MSQRAYLVHIREISCKKGYETEPLCFLKYPSYKDIKAAYEDLNKKELPIDPTDTKGKTTPGTSDLIGSPQRLGPLFEIRVAQSILV